MFNFRRANVHKTCSRFIDQTRFSQRRRLHEELKPPVQSFNELISAERFTHQIIISKSHDPFLNLSIEHHLLQNTPQSSTVLFLYVNRPCVVIGRNQNPWLEVNLNTLANPRGHLEFVHDGQQPVAVPDRIELIRRRSGGGTVFQDLGNVNYSVICPPGNFDRDKHACMVTKAIRTFNPRARVNQRHDVVLDQGELLQARGNAKIEQQTSCHVSGYDSESSLSLKVSGSAYKLTRTRALHHGTCLVCSPMVGKLSRVLKSPAAAYIRARGVDSVRSPVGNVLHATDSMEQAQKARALFQQAVVAEFCRMYSIDTSGKGSVGATGSPATPSAETFFTGSTAFGRTVGDELADDEQIAKGIQELRAFEWIYGQTPLFTFDTAGVKQQQEAALMLQQSAPSTGFAMELTARNGKVLSAEIRSSGQDAAADKESTNPIARALVGCKIQDVRSWEAFLKHDPQLQHDDNVEEAARWLQMAFTHSTLDGGGEEDPDTQTALGPRAGLPPLNQNT